MQPSNRRQHATALIGELLKTLAEDEPLLSESERTRMADLCNIYSLNRSQTKELLLQIKDLRMQEDEPVSYRTEHFATKEVAIQTDSVEEESEMNGLVIRKLLAQLQTSKREVGVCEERIQQLTRQKDERETFVKSLMEVNRVQTQVIAGLKDSVTSFTGLLKTKATKPAQVPLGQLSNIENIPIEIKPTQKNAPVGRQPMAELKSQKDPQPLHKSERERLRDQILSRIKHRRTSHHSSVATLPDESSNPSTLAQMQHMCSVQVPTSETPHFKSSNRKCSLGAMMERLKTEPDSIQMQNRRRCNNFL